MISGCFTKFTCRLSVLAAIFVFFLLSAVGAADVFAEAVLAEGGASFHPVVISPGASSDVETAAQELAQYLGLMSGADFFVQHGNGTSGIAVGTFDDFPELGLDDKFEGGPFGREQYLLRSHEDGLYLIGATPLAARNAVWDLLHRLGYRLYFPMDDWEIIPELDSISVTLDEFQSPDYITRRVGGVTRLRAKPWLHEPFHRWQVRNRAVSGFSVRSGHAWQFIIRRHRDVFDENPEYLALVDGQRGGGRGDKFCVSNEELRELVVRDAIDRIDEDTDSISMDPSDGGDFCECDQCANIGSISDQVVFLANEVAEAINNLGFDHEKYVGMYAYNHHSPPPTIDVHPNVIVSLESTHIRGGYTLDEMLDGWGDRANLLGKRECYGRTVSSSGWLPGRQRPSNLPYLIRTITSWNERGVRFMLAPSNNNWGGTGHGRYLAARMLWDTSEGERADEIIEEFLQNCFGPAASAAARYYEAVDGSTADPYVPGRTMPVDERVALMYDSLAEAWEQSEGLDEVRRRVQDLILSTRYVDLWLRIGSQEEFDEFVSFVTRIRERAIVDCVNMFRFLNRSVVNRRDDIDWPDGVGRSGPVEEEYRTKAQQGVELSTDEIAFILQDGMERHPLRVVDVEADDFGDDLIPGGFEPGAPRGEPLIRGREGNRGNMVLYLWAGDGGLPDLYFSTGHCWTGRGPLRLALSDGDGNTVQETDVHYPPDVGRRRSVNAEDWRDMEGTMKVQFDVPQPGLYRLEVTNTDQGFFWGYEPRENAGLVIRADEDVPVRRQWLDRHYFYVPRGVSEIVVAGSLRERFASWIDPKGNDIDWDEVKVQDGFTFVPVPEGMDGRIWSFRTRNDRPELRFLNVPGFLAYSPCELLVPREVLEADSE